MWLRYTAAGALLLYAVAYYLLFTGTIVVANIVALVACVVAAVCAVAYWLRRMRRHQDVGRENVAGALILIAMLLHTLSLVFSQDEVAIFFFVFPFVLNTLIFTAMWLDRYPKRMR